MSQITLAAYVKGLLVSGGHTARDRVLCDYVAETRRVMNAGVFQDPMYSRIPEFLRSGHFTSDNADDGSAVIRFHGVLRRETDVLRLYRLVLENCSLVVTEENDPKRDGRRVLRVVRG